MSMESPGSPGAISKPRWCAIGKIDRRILGVLVEKAKTTPNGYPMSLNAITTACNQKNNRAPLMQLESEDVEEGLDRLRKQGAIGYVTGAGVVQRYRHYVQEWMGIEKMEVAVMAELLLRGPQTEGELRGRAARMETHLVDLAALRPVVQSLINKGLILPLSPGGRGQVLTHALFEPQELQRQKSEFAAGAPVDAGSLDSSSADEIEERPRPTSPPAARPVPAARPQSPAVMPRSTGEDLTEAVSTLRAEIASLREEFLARLERLEEFQRNLEGS